MTRKRVGQARQHVLPGHAARQVVVDQHAGEGPRRPPTNADARAAGGHVAGDRPGGDRVRRWRHGRGTLGCRKIGAPRRAGRNLRRGRPMGGRETPAAADRGGPRAAARTASVRYELLRAHRSRRLGRRARARAVGRRAGAQGVRQAAGRHGLARRRSWRSARRRGCSRASATPTSCPCSRSPRTSDAGPFLVLELVEGLDLRALCAAASTRTGSPTRSPSTSRAPCCARWPPCSGTCPGLVHRDVTPHNVLVSAHGEVKLGGLRHRARPRPHALDAAALR